MTMIEEMRTIKWLAKAMYRRVACSREPNILIGLMVDALGISDADGYYWVIMQMLLSDAFGVYI